MPSPEETAARIIRTNRYLTMASVGQGQPWASPLAYVLDDNGDLVYYSAVEARHSRNIEANPIVSCAIFDSSLPPDSADGVQLLGEVSVVSDAELPALMACYFERFFPDMEIRRRWMRPTEDFMADSPQRFYRIRSVEAYKPDPSSTRIDRRIALDISILRPLLIAR